jgi:hypothetical protein
MGARTGRSPNAKPTKLRAPVTAGALFNISDVLEMFSF